MSKEWNIPKPPNQKDSERVNTDNGVWMVQSQEGKEDIHFATDYQDIEHNLRLGLSLVTIIATYDVLDDN